MYVCIYIYTYIYSSITPGLHGDMFGKWLTRIAIPQKCDKLGFMIPNMVDLGA